MAKIEKLGIETHSFNVSLAKEIGLAETIILQHFYFWHKANNDNAEMLKEGRVWFFRSVKSICEDFSYLSASKVKTAIEKLVEDGWLLKGDFNADRMNRVAWYSLTDYALSLFEGFPIGENRQCICENDITISENRQCKDNNKEDNNISFTDIKEKKRKNIHKKEKDDLFEQCYKAYQRKGSKKEAKSQWDKLNDEERQKVKIHIPYYVKSCSERKFQKDLVRYLRDRIFETPVYVKNQIVYDPDRDSMSEYIPTGSSMTWNDHLQTYVYVGGDMRFDVLDGYTNDNRPDGARMLCQGWYYTWNKEQKKWTNR